MYYRSHYCDPDLHEFSLVLVGWIRIRMPIRIQVGKTDPTKKLIVFKCRMFSFEGVACRFLLRLGVLHGRLGMTKFYFLKEKMKLFSTDRKFFLPFLVIKALDPDLQWANIVDSM
jgi:hypothetical protein